MSDAGHHHEMLSCSPIRRKAALRLKVGSNYCTVELHIKCTLVGPGNDSNAQTRLALLSEVKTRN